MTKDEMKLKAKVDEYFEKYMCVSFDKFIENWEQTKELLLNKDKEIERLNNIINKVLFILEHLEDDRVGYEACIELLKGSDKE